MVCTSLRCGLHNTVHVVNATEYKNNSIYTIYIYILLIIHVLKTLE